MFEKIKNAGEVVFDTAKTVGGTIVSVSKEQSSIAGMKVQKNVIEKRLQEFYAQIGKRYVDYVNNTSGEDEINISDILEQMKPDIDKLADINLQLEEKEQIAKDEEEKKSKQKVQDDFDAEKIKLDKALEMDIIDQEMYDIKLAEAQKKLDNYEQIKKIELQLKMGIIDQEEYTEKINALLK